MWVFMSDEDGYRDWLGRHPERAYVLNFRRPTPDRTNLKLHRSSCQTIKGTPPSGDGWTETYGKACSTDRGELEVFARELLGAMVDPCRQPGCFPGT